MSEEKKTRKIERPLDLQRDDVPDYKESDPEGTRRIPDDLRGLNAQARMGDETRTARRVDTGKTQIYRGPKKPVDEADYHPLSPSSTGQDSGQPEDPVVGWLVVVKGPGRGQAIRIGAEWNSIGRDPDQRICINFGDNHISRRNHAKLNYEPIARRFSITIGDGINSTYVRGENLLGPTELKAGDRIRIGDTELMFVPLCGENFDWNNPQ